MKNLTHREKTDGRGLRLAYVIGTYPRLTTTFIDREIETLRRRDVPVRIISIRRPDDATLSAEQVMLQSDITYLLPIRWRALLAAHLFYLLQQPATFLRMLGYLLTRPHPSFKARGKTVLHFGEGVYAAYCLRSEACDHLHAHFLDRAATVALVASRLLRIPYSVTAHANDIYVDPILINEKLAGAKFSVTCTGYNRKHLTQHDAALFSQRLHCIYHGLDASRYRRPARANGSGPIHLLAVGQLKERKGFHYLLDACRVLLDRGYDVRCRIVGDGPFAVVLQRKLTELGLEPYVTLCGALPHEQVIDEYRRADIFVLPAVLGSDGQRDGIPNVILEAMAMELPVVSTAHSAIPEAIEDGLNGILVPPADTLALADALATLIDEPETRRRLGRWARLVVLEQFDLTTNVDRLLEIFLGGISQELVAERVGNE